MQLSADELVKAVKAAQTTWGERVEAGDPQGVAALYAPDANKSEDAFWTDEGPGGEGAHRALVFNPTLDDDFLVTSAKTLEYFAGDPAKGNVGFAKKGWMRVYFTPARDLAKGHPKAHRYITVFEKDQSAVAVGRYIFEAERATADGSALMVTRTVVDYTFVYKMIGRDLKIIAHHSSLPIKQENAK